MNIVLLIIGCLLSTLSIALNTQAISKTNEIVGGNAIDSEIQTSKNWQLAAMFSGIASLISILGYVFTLVIST
jgi:ABC-type spermidine/putrescine transport system permease subunit I